MKLKQSKLNPTHRLYQLNIPVVAITGGIATGKSSVISLLREFGATVINADELVKDIYQYPESKDFLKKICPQVLDDQGMIDFRKLREIFFQDNSLKTQLEKWIYDRMEKSFKEKLASLPPTQVIFYEIPLLFERKMQDLFDLTVLVYASEEEQLQRVSKRDGVSADSARSVLNAQIPIEDKKHLANVVLHNNQDQQKLREEVQDFLSRYFDF